jgi:C4-dicarboxylate transporter DctM subunit
MDPVHFGIVFVTTLAIGQLTPPFGITLFTAAKVFGCSIQEISKEAIPFLIALIVALLIITYIPQTVMWVF